MILNILLLRHQTANINKTDMKTGTATFDGLLLTLEQNNIPFSVDRNPSEEKIKRIKASIARKSDLYKKTIEHFKAKI